MTHTFHFRGEYFAYDSESGALHQLDEAAFSLVRAYQENCCVRPVNPAVYAPELDAVEIEHLCVEIEKLIAADELFSEGENISTDQLYPDGIFLKAMCLNICHTCDLRCRYCFASEGTYGDDTGSMMSFETGKKAVDFLIASSGNRKNLDIDFFGGEPLLNWSVVKQLTEYCNQQSIIHDKNIRLTITTNATNLSEDKIEYLNRHFKNVVLSLDGRQEVNDKMRLNARGEGSYADVAPKIKEFVLRRGELEYYLRGTFTKHNLDFTADALHLAEFGKNISLEPVTSTLDSDYRITSPDLPRIEREYERLVACLNDMEKNGHDVNFFHFSLDLEGGPCLFKRLKGCGAGLEYCAVAPSGDIYPCHQLVGEEEYVLGSVHDQNLVLNSSIQNQFQKFLLSDQEPCNNCWARYHCGGGCAADILHANNSLRGVNEISCALLKKRLECALWLAVQRKARSVMNY
ncbi:MAG TPA: thioether cross-link-forming SCIFF peptide maturase [Clostridiaceae bacterium]|nr:thioether cross-link-forming SCIFF peptide maturase [Clostridiaceae bacterium]